MTTNQTIDGVPRDLLAWILGCNIQQFFIERHQKLKELRALLGATESQYDGLTADQARRVSAGVDELLFGTPAAQPQGEPAAWCVDREEPGHLGGYCSSAMKASGVGFEGHTKPLYAEQPAPVAADSQAMTELRHIFDSNKGADGTLVISKTLAEKLLTNK